MFDFTEAEYPPALSSKSSVFQEFICALSILSSLLSKKNKGTLPYFWAMLVSSFCSIASIRIFHSFRTCTCLPSIQPSRRNKYLAHERVVSVALMNLGFLFSICCCYAPKYYGCAGIASTGAMCAQCTRGSK